MSKEENNPAYLDEEITLTEGASRRGPSIWLNFMAVVGILFFVAFAQRVSEQKGTETLPPEPADRGIILEDLSSDKPFVESETAVMPEAGEKTPEPETVVTQPAPVIKKKPSQSTAPAPIKEPDRYTDGGPQDLDRAEMRDAYRKKNVVRVPVKEAQALPPEVFIPFEE